MVTPGAPCGGQRACGAGHQLCVDLLCDVVRLQDWTTTKSTVARIHEVQRQIEEFASSAVGVSQLVGKTQRELQTLAAELFEDMGVSEDHLITKKELPVRHCMMYSGVCGVAWQMVMLALFRRSPGRRSSWRTLG